MDLPNRLLPVLIGLVAIVVPASRRGVALAGAVVSGLALASLEVAGGPQWLDAGLPPTYFAITAALLAFGLLLALGAGLRPVATGIDDPWRRSRVGASLLLLALGGYAVTIVGKAGGALPSLAALAGLGAMVGGLSLALRASGASARIGGVRARLAERLRPGRERSLGRTDLGLLGLHLAAAAVALLAGNLVWVVLGVVGASVSGWRLARRTGHRFPWGAALGVLILVLVSGLMIQVAGDTSLRLSELPNGPFSPAFEPLAVLGFLIAAWPLLRLWPFHYDELGAFTPLAASMLLARVAGPVLPAGMEHWQPLVFPLLVLAAWSTLISGDWRQAVRALGVAGVITLGGAGARAGGVLLAGEGLLAFATVSLPARFRGPAAVLLLLAMVLQLVPLFDAALRAQTFYTVLLGVSVALVLVNVTPAPGARPAR